MNILEAMDKYKVPNLVFSSSCTVYGQPDVLPATEETPIKKAESPYGNTKQINEEIIRDEAHAKHVASITTGGARMMYFYADDDTYLAGLVGKMASEFSDYEFNYLLEKDAPWNFYFNVVYPSLLDMQIMKNRRMIRLMAEQGEDLNEVREVTHWFFFNNGASRKQASVRLRDGGCEILDDNFFDERVPEFNFGMRVLIKHNMTQEKMLEVTYALYDFIERYEGIYDGWNIIPDGDPEKSFV